MLHERNIQAEIPSLQGKVAPEEWQARVDLAACYRLVALYEMSDMVANHISMRVPGEENAFLINAYGMLYEEITASSLIKIDHDGNILAKPDFGPGLDYGINRAGFVIHSAVHEAKPDVACVIHTHTWAGMAIASLECGLLPLTQTAMRFAKIGYHDYHGVVLDLTEQEELVQESRRQQCDDPAQSRPANDGPHDRRGIQCHASARNVVQIAARCDGLRRQTQQSAGRYRREDVYELPAAGASPVWRDGMAGFVAQAR